MKQQTFSQASYLDILFDKRNKAYGAYELKAHYQQRTLRSMLFILFISIAFCTYSYFYSNIKTTPMYAGIFTQPMTPVDMTPRITPPTPPPAPPARQTMQQHIKTDAFTASPVITDAPDIKTMTTTIGTDAGIKTTVGAGTDLGTSITPSSGTGISTNTTAILDVPVKWVEQMPAFSGDINRYLNDHLHYPEMARSNGITGRVIVQFVVNEDGDISDAKVLKGIGGGCDEEALNVVKSMPPWKPGKQNGKPVKVYFTLPILFMLQ